MSSSAAPLILISALLLISSIATTTAINITYILDKFPDYGEFKNLLNSTNLAVEINRRRTITVLALSNGLMGEIYGKTEEVQKRILSNHVILDYYDIVKLNKLKGPRTVLTTLFQASGIAEDQQGFLVVTRNGTDLYFGSAVHGSPIDARFEGSVFSRPYNISVLSISHPIIAPGIDGTLRPMPTLPPPAAPAPVDKVPPPAESPAEEVPADAPAPDSDVAADAPAPSDAPSLAPSLAPGPADDQPADSDDTESSASAAGKQLISGMTLGLMMALASFLAGH